MLADVNVEQHLNRSFDALKPLSDQRVQIGRTMQVDADCELAELLRQVGRNIRRRCQIQIEVFFGFEWEL